MTIAAKVNYVGSQSQYRKHTCHWPGCEIAVPPAMWGCRMHWFSLPTILRNQIWAAYRPGQEITGKPSREYVTVAVNVRDWIINNTKRLSNERDLYTLDV
jgi:hypothetical protein